MTFDPSNHRGGHLISVDDVHVAETKIALAIQAGAVGAWEWDVTRNDLWVTHDLSDLSAPAGSNRIDLSLFFETIDIFHRPLVRRAFELARVGGERINVEFRVALPSRHSQWLLLRGDRINPANSNVISGVIIDASDQYTLTQKRNLQQTALVEIAQHQWLATGQFRAAAQEVARTGARILGVARCGVWLFNHDQTELSCEALALVGADGAVRIESGVVLKAQDFPRYFRAAAAARVLPASDAAIDPRTSEYKESYLDPLGINSMLDAPVRREGKVVGVVCHESVNSRRVWTHDEQSFAAALGDLVGTALEAQERRVIQGALRSTIEAGHAHIGAHHELTWRSTIDPPISIRASTQNQVEALLNNTILSEITAPNDITRQKNAQAFLGQKPTAFYDVEALRKAFTRWVDAHYVTVGEVFQRAVAIPRGGSWVRIIFVGLIKDGFLREILGMESSIVEDDAEKNALQHRAFQDDLTRLPNRDRLMSVFKEHLASAQPGEQCAVFLFDINHFKELNDTLGHAAGDDLLRAISPRIHPIFEQHAGAFFARVGSDEFAILVPAVSAQCAQQYASAVVDVCRQPFAINEHIVEMGITLGWALAPGDGDRPDELLRRAEVALYSAKTDPIGHRRYSPSLDEHSQRRFLLMTQIEAAIARKEFFVELQPILFVADRALYGFEALVRWQHPVFGRVAPGEFIRLAEITQSILPLTEFVVSETLRIAKTLNFHEGGLNVNINFSPRLLKHCSVAKWLELVARYGFSPQSVTLEITETEILVDSDAAIESLSLLRAAGFRIAIDDFGTGYSSLALLRAIDVDAIKIDPSFVSKMNERTKDEKIVRSTIQLARQLGLQVVAEGVEDEHVYSALTDAECDAAQGYDISRPLGEDALAPWLAALERGRVK